MPNNVSDARIVAVRPMQRSDVAAFAGWGRHTDPLFLHYNIPAMTPADADGMWAYLSGSPDLRRPYAGLVGERMVASLLVRDIAGGSGGIGIILDPAYIGRGLGRRILTAFVAVLGDEGFERVHLDVAGYNGRAIAAYCAAGFTVTSESWGAPEPGLALEALLAGPAAATIEPHVRVGPDARYRTRIVRMERRLQPHTKDERSS